MYSPPLLLFVGGPPVVVDHEIVPPRRRRKTKPVHLTVTELYGTGHPFRKELPFKEVT